MPDAGFTQVPETPDRADQPDRHVDEKDQTPVEASKHSADDDTEERTAHRRDHVDAQGEAALVGWEGVGKNRRRARHHHRAAYGHDHAQDDQLNRPGGALAPHGRETDRGDREYGESDVVDARPA